MLDPKMFINYSGGAKGSDTMWELIGKEYGIGKQINFRPEDLNKLTSEQDFEVEEAYKEVVKSIKRKFLHKNTYSGGLVRRDYLQAIYSHAIFAIATITNNIVDGGTAYAVHSAINLGKPVYVFDQNLNIWFTYKNNQFIKCDVPILTKKYAGIGTRNIKPNGIIAIREVYNKTFNHL